MKWGIRRYQNEDGTLTLLGRRRVAQGKAKVDKKTGAYLRTTFKERRHAKKLKEQRIKNLKKARDKKDATNEPSTKNIVDNNPKKSPFSSKPKKAKNMSDAELNAQIERLKKEKEYNNLLNDTRTSEKGKSFVKKQLSSAGNQFLSTVIKTGAVALGAAAAKTILDKAFVKSNNSSFGSYVQQELKIKNDKKDN
jgi:hypothetical protein